MSETHLKDNDQILIDGYHFVGLNRKLDGNRRGCGGVGILIRTSLLVVFNVDLILNLNDNILRIKLTEYGTGAYHVIYCVYLPPDSSPYGCENEHLLNQLVVDLYKHTDTETVMIGGDFNARIGKRKDCYESDDLPKRVVLDEETNPQGTKFINFINDMKGCIVNGCISPDLDDFTSVTSHKGKSVIDYYVTRHGDLENVKQMAVVSCTDIVNMLQKQHLVTKISKLPDHNVLTIKVEMSMVARLCDRNMCIDQNLGSRTSHRALAHQKKGDMYMQSETAIKFLPILLASFEKASDDQNEINLCCQNLTDFLVNEVELSMKDKNRKHKGTKFKEYWNKELSEKWATMHQADK